MASEELIQAIAVTAELCGRTFSPEAAAMFVQDLAGFPEPAVFGALRRCRREVRGVLTVQDVVSRLDDGRPGPEEAWALLPLSESQTAVWTEEMAQAFAVALPLIDSGEIIPARMAFKEAYLQRVAAARDEARPVAWSATMGHDTRAREGVLLAAVEKGRLTIEQARDLAPSLPAPSAKVLALVEPKRVSA